MTSPKINVPPVEPGQDAALYINSLTDPNLMGAYMQFYVAARELPPADPELVEMVRLRNGVAQSCQYCLSVRLDGGYDLGSDTEFAVTRFETSDLPDRQKAALRLAAAFLEMPSELTQEARDEAQKYFTPEEIVGLLFKLTSFLINKPRAALGIDGALDPERLTPIVSGESLKRFLPES
jgi:alkylhydroperoxidase family enzyme